MNSVTYGIVEKTYVLENVVRVSYGIAAYQTADNEGMASLSATIHDITNDKEKLMAFVETCNRLSLSIVHLSDVVEDFLAK